MRNAAGSSLSLQSMADSGDPDLLRCSFCGKSQKQVKKLIAGPSVLICGECVDLSTRLIQLPSSRSSCPRQQP